MPGLAHRPGLKLAYRRPHIGRVVVVSAYVLASAGLLALAYDHILFDRYAIVGASVASLILLTVILFTGQGGLWLGVGGAWIYGAVIEMLRGPTTADRVGVSLIFVAMALGALGAYTAYRRDQAVNL